MGLYQTIYRIDCETELKILPKLTENHMDMNVPFAKLPLYLKTHVSYFINDL